MSQMRMGSFTLADMSSPNCWCIRSVQANSFHWQKNDIWIFNRLKETVTHDHRGWCQWCQWCQWWCVRTAFRMQQQEGGEGCPVFGQPWEVARLVVCRVSSRVNIMVLQSQHYCVSYKKACKPNTCYIRNRWAMIKNCLWGSVMHLQA